MYEFVWKPCFACQSRKISEELMILFCLRNIITTQIFEEFAQLLVEHDLTRKCFLTLLTVCTLEKLTASCFNFFNFLF